MIEIKDMLNMLIIMTGIKFTLENWQPPIQKSLQAIICLIIGVGLGFFFDPTKNGIITGLVGGVVSFWGSALFATVKDITDASKGYTYCSMNHKENNKEIDIKKEK